MSDVTQDSQIAVIGAGPAGARAAEFLAKAGAEVLLLDPKAPWEKPCGGGLTESAFQAVPELRELVADMGQVRTVRIETDAQHGFALPLSTPIRMVSRMHLARWQLDRARAAGARHLPVRARSIAKLEDRWLIETDGGRVSADGLVGADGAASLVRRSVTPDFDVELAPTRVAYVPGAGPTPDTMLLRFFPLVAGYVWDFPRPDHRSVGVGLQEGGWRRPRMDAAVDDLRRSTEACRCADEEIQRAGAVIGTAQLGHGDFSRIADDDFALLGDAAGLADPTTGEGIRNAMRSAELLAQAWQADGHFAAYPELARAAFTREFQVSRVLRRLVFGSRLTPRALRAARNSTSLQALAATLADAINEHDGSPWSLIRRWWRARRTLRSGTAPIGPDVRTPVPCGGCPCS